MTNSAGRKLSGICVIASTGTGDSSYAIGSITAAGQYSLTYLIPGRYQVIFLTGCGNNSNYAPQWWRHALTVTKATAVRVTAGATVTGINAALVRGAAISGVVRFRGKAGPPLAGICVTATGLGGMLGIQSQVSSLSTGRYRLTSLGTGKYRVQFAPGTGCPNNGNYLAATYHRAVSATDGKTTGNIDAYLQPGGVIDGVVTDTASNPLDGICVSISGTVTSGLTISGPDGSYSINQLPADSYSVSFTGGCGAPGSYAPQVYDGQANSAAASLVVIGHDGQVRSGIDARMYPGGSVSGLVTSASGTNLSDVCVGLTSPALTAGLGPSPLAGLLIVPSFGAYVQASAGYYEIDNLAPGPYQAEFFSCAPPNQFASQWFKSQPGPTRANLITVGAGVLTTGVDAVLQRSGTITGVVTGPACGRLTGICVTTTNLADHTQDEAQATLINPFTSAGSYTITGLAPGRYAVQFTACEGQPYASQWYRGQASLGSATAVTVRSGKVTSGINVRLGPGASISGRVISGLTRRPLRGVCVLASDAAARTAALASTAASGRYVIRHLAAGSYAVDFFSCSSFGGSLAAQVRTGVRVTGSRSASGINTVLGRSGSISGIVKGGRPAAAQPGICVEAAPRTGPGVAGLAITGRHGTYLLGGLAPGRYQLLFTPVCAVGTAALVPQWFSGQPSQATARRIRVRAGATHTGINATLVADGGIAGKVTGPGPVELIGICVTAVPASGRAPSVIAITRAGGYQASDLAPGRYKVEFSPGCGLPGYATQWYRGQSSEGAANTVTVSPGAITPGISATLKP